METDTINDPAGDAPGQELPPPGAPVSTPERPAGTPVIGGVALDLAGRFGVDPVWPRLAFVALALLDGFGILAYLGLWLVLIVGGRPGWAWARILGAGVLFGSVFLLQDVDDPWIDSPWAWAVLLAGVAVALWAPRGIPGTTAPTAVAGPAITGVADRAAAAGEREPSVLGQATLGLAIVVAAGGALIDQLNGGRLHPEQWLGAAAVVCGLGLFVGAVRGRALWLLAPGLLFAGAGFLAGHAARAGVDSLSLGDEDVWIDAGPVGATDETLVAGTARLTVADEPTGAPLRSELRVGIGEIDIDVDDDVTVEVHPIAHDGEVRVDGQAVRDNDVVTVGPEGEPDVIVDAEISLGDIEIERFDFNAGPDIVPPERPRPPWLRDRPEVMDGAIDIGDGVQMGSDGTVLLPDGAGAIGPNGEIWSPFDYSRRPDGVIEINSDFGLFLVLPNQMIITPNGALVDVPARRAEVLGEAAPTTVTVTPTTRPGG